MARPKRCRIGHLTPYCVCCVATPATTLLLSVLTMNIVVEFATYPSKSKVVDDDPPVTTCRLFLFVPSPVIFRFPVSPMSLKNVLLLNPSSV